MALNDLGEVPAGSVLPLFWTSHDLATGANEAMSGLAVTDIEVYKGVSVTQRASDAGYALLDTDGIDFDSHVGVNGISIDLGNDTDAGFYAVGSFYNVIVGPVTIDTRTVNIHLASFRIGASVASLNNLSAAQVNTEVVDALATDTYAEPGQGTPAATATLAVKIGQLYAAHRNRHTVTESEWALYADDGSTKIQERVLSDDGTTFTAGEVATGA